MACWLYQMNDEKYSHRRYRNEIWEGSITQNWTLGKSKHRPNEIIQGDTLLLFYAKTVTEPGIYGWGIITFFDKEAEEIHFRPSPPSDYLKMTPLWDDKIDRVVNKIRGGMPEGTMYPVGDIELNSIRQKIAEHTYGVVSKD